MKRKDFIRSAGAFAVASLTGNSIWGQDHSPTGVADYELRQKEIDEVTPDVFIKYYRSGLDIPLAQLRETECRYPAISRLEKAFSKVFDEVRHTVVKDLDKPAVWYLYNMGIIVKTPNRLFSIDLHHRRAEEFAQLLDFACITHNHGDHYTERFKVAMDRGHHKCVINNFFDNYGVKNRSMGGFTRAKSKVFDFGEVKVTTGLCDHNSYLVDYTTTFEVHVGNFTLFHSGDCCSCAKFQPKRKPDLWVLHPYCGMNPAEASRTVVHPKKVVIAHLQEMCHSRNRYRWTYRDGLKVKDSLLQAGVDSVIPMWGERIL